MFRCAFILTDSVLPAGQNEIMYIYKLIKYYIFLLCVCMYVCMHVFFLTSLREIRLILFEHV